MARESMRKRAEKRFGRPERLADMIAETPHQKWRIFGHLTQGGDPQVIKAAGELVEEIRREVSRCPIISADNVGKFFYDHPKDEWAYREDFPNSAPPFPAFFLESRVPPTMTCDGGDVVTTRGMPSSFGWLFVAADARGRDFPPLQASPRFPGHPGGTIEGARWYVSASLVTSDGTSPTFAGVQKLMAIGPGGEQLIDPGTLALNGPNLGASFMDDLSTSIGLYFMPALLALSFLNCKNVALAAVDPDPRLNATRERAGLKPFLRYHTLNIEPMKAVLRTEGGIEANGLKKALHIARGHFATYTEERPLFGKVAGTFWVPAHVRGSVKHGVVAKDYRVGAPGAGGAA